MIARINGEDRDIPRGSTVGSVMTALGTPRRGVAVAVNREVVPRGEWDAIALADGDSVEVLTAAQGG